MILEAHVGKEVAKAAVEAPLVGEASICCGRGDDLSSAGGLGNARVGVLKTDLRPSCGSGWRGGSPIVLLEGPKISKRSSSIRSSWVTNVGAR